MGRDVGVDGRAAAELHVVVGAGPIGSGVACALVAQGRRVRLITRSGSAPLEIALDEPRVTVPSGSRETAQVTARESVPVGSREIEPGGERSAEPELTRHVRPASSRGTLELVAADASDAAAMARLAEGAAVLYNCANPAYHRWPELWPPIATALLGAAERSGAVLVTISNLYGYGPASLAQGTAGYDAAHPLTESTPLAATGRKGAVRARMWQDALAAHQAGRVRATEVRASDYVGPGAESVLGSRVVPNVLRGRGVVVLGRADRAHTWTYTGDVVAMAITAGSDPRAWGRVWHAPSGPPRTQRDAVGDLARAAGRAPVPVRVLPGLVVRAAGVFSPLMRELGETRYQFAEDFVLDSSAARETFGLAPTPWEQVLETVLRSFGWQSRTSVAGSLES